MGGAWGRPLLSPHSLESSEGLAGGRGAYIRDREVMPGTACSAWSLWPERKSQFSLQGMFTNALSMMLSSFYYL